MQVEKEGIFSVVECVAVTVIVAATLYFCLYRQIGHAGVRSGLVLFLVLFFLALAFAIPKKRRRADFMQGCWLWLGWIVYGIIFEMYVIDTIGVYATSFFQTLVVCLSLTKLSEKNIARKVFVFASLISMAIPTTGNTWPNSFGLFQGIRTLVFFFVHSFACQQEDKMSARPTLRFVRSNWVLYVSPAFLVFAGVETFVLLKEMLWLQKQQNVKDSRDPVTPVLPITQPPITEHSPQTSFTNLQEEQTIQTPPLSQMPPSNKFSPYNAIQLKSGLPQINGIGKKSNVLLYSQFQSPHQTHSSAASSFTSSSTTSNPRNGPVVRPPSSSSEKGLIITTQMVNDYEQSIKKEM